MAECAKCGAGVPPQVGAGRPRKHCAACSPKRSATSGNTPPVKAKPSRRAAVKVGPSAGDRLRAEMAREGDPVGLVMLIRQAARIADRLEAIDRLLSGDADVWALVSLPRSDEKRGRLLVEVQVGDVLKEERAQSVLFRHLLADIHKQRAGLRGGRGDDDDEDDDLVD